MNCWNDESERKRVNPEKKKNTHTMFVYHKAHMERSRIELRPSPTGSERTTTEPPQPWDFVDCLSLTSSMRIFCTQLIFRFFSMSILQELLSYFHQSSDRCMYNISCLCSCAHRKIILSEWKKEIKLTKITNK